MSQAGISNLAQTGGGGLIQTINGDTGSITGNTVTIHTNQALLLSGATVKFTNSGTVSTLTFFDSPGNLFLGILSGNLTYTGASNIGIGNSCFQQITSGSNNVGIGSTNSVLITTGNSNTCIGDASGGGYDSGSYNTCLGYGSGGASTGSDSSNIFIRNVGVSGDNNRIRIGTQGSGAGQQNTAYIAGIIGVTNSNAQLVTINSSTGQLGVTTSVVSTGTDVTSATQQLAVGNGYVTDRGGGVTYTLPATATFWDKIIIVGKLGITTITPNANQQIVIGSVSGTVGVTGTAVGTNAGNCITLRCITGGSSSVWAAESFIGNWTLT